MKLKKIEIKNYKSIKDLTFIPNEGINVIIGGNNAGKSNIFDAINWLIGESWPSFNNVVTEDHFQGKKENKINITLNFDNYTGLSLDEANGEKLTDLQGQWMNNDKREPYISAYVDMNRKIIDSMPSNKWTLLGRFLYAVNEKFKEDTEKVEEFKIKIEELTKEYLFSVKDEDDKNIMDELKKEIESSLKDQVGSIEETKFDFSLVDSWNYYKTLQLLIKDEELDFDIKASSQGMGVQASLTIAILRAYAKLKLKNQPPIFIDEPEIFLHPHSKRQFYSVLRELSKTNQIFYTTHSPEFVSVSNFNEIFLVNKDKDEGTKIKQIETSYLEKWQAETNQNSIEDILSYCKERVENVADSLRANEAFFAKQVILVEGASESLILPYFFKIMGIDINKQNISIVDCGGKDPLDTMYKIYTGLNIPCYIIFDGDQDKANQEEQKAKNKRIMKIFTESPLEFPDNQVNDNYLGFPTKLEDYLGIEGISNDCKGNKLLKLVKSEIVSADNIPQWFKDLILKLNVLKTSIPLGYEADDIEEVDIFPF